jgi:hypothetical protein
MLDGFSVGGGVVKMGMEASYRPRSIKNCLESQENPQNIIDLCNFSVGVSPLAHRRSDSSRTFSFAFHFTSRHPTTASQLFYEPSQSSHGDQQ